MFFVTFTGGKKQIGATTRKEHPIRRIGGVPIAMRLQEEAEITYVTHHDGASSPCQPVADFEKKTHNFIKLQCTGKPLRGQPNRTFFFTEQGMLTLFSHEAVFYPPVPRRLFRIAPSLNLGGCGKRQGMLLLQARTGGAL